MKRSQIDNWRGNRRKLQCVVATLVVASLAACGGSNGGNPPAPPDGGPTGGGPVGPTSECPADAGTAVDALAACGGSGVICVGYHNGSTIFDLEPLTSGASPAWSPDGLEIAFYRVSDGIYLINADGTGERWLTDGWQPAWSPDGNRLAFTSSDGISVIRKDGTGAATLIRHDPVAGFLLHAPAWSPDGQQIAYAESRGEDVFPGKIQVMNADGGNPRRVTPERMIEAFEDYPAWSPSGDRIAFNTYDRAIAIIDVAGGDPRLVVGSVAEVSRSAWSPEGTQLAYTVGSCGPGVAIHSVDVEDEPIRVLVGQAREPTWSPDGARLAFVTVGDGATYVPPGAFPAVPDTAEVYVRESVDSGFAHSRYVLLPTGRFELQYLSIRRGYFSYAGGFSRNGANLRFGFDGSSIAGPWEATGVLDGDRLRIEYNLIMLLSDFEDAVYVRSGG